MAGTEGTLLSRRLFLATSAAVAGCASVATLRSFSAVDAMATETEQEQVFYNVCMWTCPNCQYNVVVRDGNVVRAEPIDDAAWRMCLRGRAQMQRQYSEQRIKYPMKRAGARGENKWERITWEEALETIATQWKKTAETYGPQANCWYHGSGGIEWLNGANLGLMTRLMNSLRVTDLDYCTDYASAMGITRVFYGNSLSYSSPNNEAMDWVNSKALIFWGANVTDSCNQCWRWVANAQEHGTVIVSVDPLFLGVAAKSDKWIHPFPGTDGALILGMSKYLVDQGKCDYDFLRAHTCATYLINAQTKGYLRLSELAEATQARIREATVSMLADPVIVWDEDLGDVTTADDAISPALSGKHVVGGVETLGTAWDMLCDHLAEWSLEKASSISCVPVEDIVWLADLCATGQIGHYQYYGPQAYSNGIHSTHALMMLVCITGSVGKPGAWVGSFNQSFDGFNYLGMFPKSFSMKSSIPILAAYDVMATGKFNGVDWPLKNLWVTHGNPLTSNVNSNRLRREIFDKLEFIVTTAIDFSETARYSDIVLPPAHYYEFEDIVHMSTYPEVRISEKCIDPLFESKKDADIAREFAKAYGIEDDVCITDEEYWNTVFGTPYLQAYGITMDELRKQKCIRQPETPAPNIPSTTFATPTGRAEFYVDQPFLRQDFGQVWDKDFERLPHYFPSHEADPGSEAAKKYPLVLLSRRNKTRWHCNGFANNWMLEIMPEPYIEISPADAAARSIKTGDYVEVFNDRGHAVVKAVIHAGMQETVTCYPKGFQNFEFKAGSWSEVTSDYYDPVAVNCSFMDNRVEIRLWDGKEA